MIPVVQQGASLTKPAFNVWFGLGSGWVGLGWVGLGWVGLGCGFGDQASVTEAMTAVAQLGKISVLLEDILSTLKMCFEMVVSYTPGRAQRLVSISAYLC